MVLEDTLVFILNIFATEATGQLKCLIPVLVLLSSPDSSSPPGGDETDLSSGTGAPLDRRSLTDMLMVTTTMGMLDWVHGHTTHLGPAVPLGLVLVVGSAGLQHGLLGSTASGHDAHHGAVGRGHHLLGSRGQLDAGPLGVGVVGNDGGVVSGCAGQLASVSGLLFEVGDDGSLGHHADGHHVSDGQLGLLAAVDELSGVHAFAGNHQFLADLVSETKLSKINNYGNR